MMSTHRRLAAALVLAIMPAIDLPSSASAAVLFSQSLLNTASGDAGPFSDASLQVADAFILPATSQIQSLEWYGTFFGRDLGAATTATFTIRFFLDNGSASPRDSFITPQFTLSATATHQGVNDPLTNGDDLYLFHADLPSAVTITGGSTYWLSILGQDIDAAPDGGVGFGRFRWAVSSPGDLSRVRTADNVAWASPSPHAAGEGRSELAFSLLGEAAVTDLVPEPTTHVALSILALLLAPAFRRRLPGAAATPASCSPA